MADHGTEGRRWWPIAAALIGLLVGVLVTTLVLRTGDDRSSAPTTTTVTVPAAPECGPDRQGALDAAFARLSPDPTTGLDWSGVPTASNYDPCADLSAILVSVVGGTGSSPTQALLFHRGAYVGPATPEPHGMTTLDAQASTGDTVVLNYRTGQSCTACDDGTVTAVRYQWDGAGVTMLDPTPPR